MLKNVPYIDVARGVDPEWYAATRSTALVVILLRACLGLSPAALRKLSAMVPPPSPWSLLCQVFRLAFLPCLAETLAVAVAARLLLSMPWLWGAMLGFVLAAVSPAVVVSCLLNLQERGYGVAKGIPTLVIAAGGLGAPSSCPWPASMDDVLAISGFTLLLGATFNKSGDLAMLVRPPHPPLQPTKLLHGPLEALVGVLWGLGWGALAALFPPGPQPSILLRLTILVGGALLALVGSDLVHLKVGPPPP